MTFMLSTDYMTIREIQSKIMDLYSYYNGKVNKILPATGLNFTNSQYVPPGSCDRTKGEILFSLPRMKEMINSHKYKYIALLYAVIHELSHMDQYYEDTYGKDSEYTNYVEKANTRRSLEFIYENTSIFNDVYNSGNIEFYEAIKKEYQDIKTNGYNFEYITPHIVLDEIVKFASDNQVSYDMFDTIELSILNFKSTNSDNKYISDDVWIPVKGQNSFDYRVQFMILADVRKAIESYSYECKFSSNGKHMLGLIKLSHDNARKFNVFQPAIV